MRMNPRIELTDEQVEALGDELDELRGRVIMDLGERDLDYIRRVIKVQRALEVGGRGLLFAGFLPPAWLAGTTALALSKILDNMEIGHNVMHGQYDWCKDPALDSKRFEWDTACPGDQWRHSHNYMHHTHTNVLGKDRDIGYGILRMSEDQPWRPRDIGNPLYALLLALLFQWGVALHDLEVERIEAGEITLEDKRDILQAIWRKGRRQVLKDYVVFPLLAGPVAPFVLTGNLTANLTRNVWSFMIIFCGHFPAGVEEFSEEEVEGETRGGWYLRQMLGSANLTGQPPVPHPQRQPLPPDRASPVPGHPRPPLRGDGRRGARDLRALRPALQHRAAAQAVRLGGQEDLPAGAARGGKGRAGPEAELHDERHRPPGHGRRPGRPWRLSPTASRSSPWPPERPRLTASTWCRGRAGMLSPLGRQALLVQEFAVPAVPVPDD